jgi:hypothetical protein
MNRRTVNCLFVILAAGCATSVPAFAQCQVSITAPADGTVVRDNGTLAHIDLFGFAIEGRATGLGANRMCLYQKVTGGTEWWMSGNALGSNDLGPGGSWRTIYASCGKRNSPHLECQAKAVVQSSCPPSGQTRKDIGRVLCESPTYTYRTR